MKDLLLLSVFLLTSKAAFPVYNNEKDFGLGGNAPDPAYTDQGGVYAAYPQCGSDLDKQPLFVYGSVKLLKADYGGYNCKTMTDKQIDDILDDACSTTYDIRDENGDKIVVRNIRGIELQEFFYDARQFFTSGGVEITDKVAFGQTDNLLVYTVPSCTPDGDYCGGSCGRYDPVQDIDGCKGRRICASNNNRNPTSCLEIPLNGFWDDYNYVDNWQKNNWILPTNGEANQQGGGTSCWSQRKEEGEMAALCVACRRPFSICTADTAPCSIPVIGGISNGPFTIGVLPQADRVAIFNIQTPEQCQFDLGGGVVFNDPPNCEIDINPPIVPEGTIDITFTPAVDGLSLIHQYVNCANKLSAPSSLPCIAEGLDTVFIIQTNPSPNPPATAFTFGEITIQGCDGTVSQFLDPTTGNILPKSEVPFRYNGAIPVFVLPDSTQINAIAVRCIPNGANSFKIDCEGLNLPR